MIRESGLLFLATLLFTSSILYQAFYGMVWIGCKLWTSRMDWIRLDPQVDELDCIGLGQQKWTHVFWLWYRYSPKKSKALSIIII